MDSSTPAQLNGSWPHYGRWCGSQNGRYGKSSRSSAETSSLRFDVGGPDHLAPLLCFFADELAEVGGRARKRRRTQIAEPCLYLGFGKSNVYLLVQFVDNFERRVLWCGYAEPITGHETRDELTDGRYLWQNVRTHSCGHCQRPQFAGPKVLD